MQKKRNHNLKKSAKEAYAGKMHRKIFKTLCIRISRIMKCDIGKYRYAEKIKCCKLCKCEIVDK